MTDCKGGQAENRGITTAFSPSRSECCAGSKHIDLALGHARICALKGTTGSPTIVSIYYVLGNVKRHELTSSSTAQLDTSRYTTRYSQRVCDLVVFEGHGARFPLRRMGSLTGRAVHQAQTFSTKYIECQQLMVHNYRFRTRPPVGVGSMTGEFLS